MVMVQSCSIDSIDVESKPWAILWLHMSRLPAIRGITSTWSPWMRNCTQTAPLDWQTLSEKPKLPEHVPVKASTWYPVGPVGEYLHCLMVSPALGIPALQQVSRAWRKCALCGSIGVTLPAWMICLFGAEWAAPQLEPSHQVTWLEARSSQFNWSRWLCEFMRGNLVCEEEMTLRILLECRNLPLNLRQCLVFFGCVNLMSRLALRQLFSSSGKILAVWSWKMESPLLSFSGAMAIWGC